MSIGAVLPKGWVHTTLSSFCDVIQGQSPPGHTYNTQRQGLPFFQGKAEFGDVHPRPVKWCRAPAKIAEANDILISIRAPVGPTNMATERACIGRGLAAIRPWCGVDPKYVLYALRASERTLAAKGTGSTFTAIAGADLKSHVIRLAPIPEQSRIVSEIEKQLTRLDAAVAALDRARANLRRYRASVLKAAVEGRLVPIEADLARAEGRDYEPAEVLRERILAERRRLWEEAELATLKAGGKKGDAWKSRYQEPLAPDTSNLPNLPDGWCWASIDQVGDVSGGLTVNSKRSAYALKCPYLRVANVYADELRLDDVAELGVEPQEVARVLLKKHDLLVVEGNGSIEQIGRVALWDGSIEPCLHQNHLIKIRFQPVTLARWVLTWLLSTGGRAEIMRVASSTSGLHTLSLSKVGALPVPLCPVGEMARILEKADDYLSVVETSNRCADDNLKRLARLRRAVLKWAFEGKLAPQDPNDEPATVLLERIRKETAATAEAAAMSEPERRSRRGRRGTMGVARARGATR